LDSWLLTQCYLVQQELVIISCFQPFCQELTIHRLKFCNNKFSFDSFEYKTLVKLPLNSKLVIFVMTCNVNPCDDLATSAPSSSLVQRSLGLYLLDGPLHTVNSSQVYLYLTIIPWRSWFIFSIHSRESDILWAIVGRFFYSHLFCFGIFSWQSGPIS